MSSTQASSRDGHKKILRTRVKVWSRFALRPEEVFNADKAEQLIHRAVEGKKSVQTALKMYSEGLRIGEKGILATLNAEFISYTSITAFISLRESPTMLALCNKIGEKCFVNVLQFKDVEALELVCNIIDRQRGLMSGVRAAAAAPSLPASSLSRSEGAVQQTPTVVVTPAAEEPPTNLGTVTTTITTTETNVTRAEDESVVAASSGGRVELFEKRPFAADITQPPASADVTAVVHSPPAPSTSAAKTPTVDDDEDDNLFHTSIVFGEEVPRPAAPTKVTVTTESTDRQQRMDALLQQRSNGHALVDTGSKRVSSGPIETVILNYDDVETEGTHAVFDTPDGPPIQLNESADNVRWRRPESLQVTASSSFNSGSAQQTGASRHVVTSFSSGRSDSFTDSQAVQLRASPIGSAGKSYRTSTVIYRDSPDGPPERPRVTYASSSYQQQQQRTLHMAPPSHQQQQLVRLVPVGSGRRRVVQSHHQPQVYTIQPVATGRENGVYMSSK